MGILLIRVSPIIISEKKNLGLSKYILPEEQTNNVFVEIMVGEIVIKSPYKPWAGSRTAGAKRRVSRTALVEARSSAWGISRARSFTLFDIVLHKCCGELGNLSLFVVKSPKSIAEIAETTNPHEKLRGRRSNPGS